MNGDRKNSRELLVLVFGGIAFYCILQHLGVTVAGIRWLLGTLSPLLLGAAMAFILNVPVRAIERGLLMQMKQVKVRRPLAIVLALAAVAVVLVLASAVIVPGIREAADSVAAHIPAALERLEAVVLEWQEYLPHLAEEIRAANVDWQNLSKKAVELLQTWGKGLLVTGGGVIGGVVGAVTTFVVGFVFAMYILLQKEKLARQGRQICYALLSEQTADRVLGIARLSEQTFSRFLSGQCLEAVILGALFVGAMTFFRFPYALLVGVLIAITALVPIVGAFIGCVVGALLIAIVDPWRALWFIVMFLIIQQLEGNLIYPRVVGSSVGLPAIWVLAAVTVGGSLLGVVGMLVFIPLCSVLYALFRTFVYRRLAIRKVPAEKWQDIPQDKK